MSVDAARGAGFVHLAVHTEYSLADSVVRIPALVQAVRARGMPAVAVTEAGNFFSLVKFYREAERAGVKPIVGAELQLECGHGPSRAVFLCRRLEGYRRLADLVSRSYLEGGGKVRADWLDEAAAEELIVISGFRDGAAGAALARGEPELARRIAREWLARFGGDRYYLGIERLGREGEERLVEETVDLAAAIGAPVVATNEVRFLAPEEFDAHEARVCIGEGRMLEDPERPRRYTAEQYLRSPEEMRERFPDLPEALENTVEIARRCTVELDFGANNLPEFPVEPGESVDERFAAEAREGLRRRLAASVGAGAGAAVAGGAAGGGAEDGGGVGEAADPGVRYRERLEHEIRVVSEKGFSSYYLIVADFVKWARRNDVPVGPGRGSGAGSLAAWALEITDIDPLAYDLLFERFLNPERVSMPDFDIDFCMEKRDRVIEYVIGRYGEDRVSQIITFGTMAAKAAVRDVGRVLGHSFPFVDMIAKLIPFDLGITLERALREEEGLREQYERSEDARTIIDLARSLEGLARNAGRHAGGIVIAPGPLTRYTPIYRDPDGGEVVTQLDKDDIEAMGLVKFDFLGLKTLTVIDRALSMINEARPAGTPPLEPGAIPTGDPATYELIRSGATTGVFQLESRGMRDLVKKLKPGHFEDIVALLALFRPGPLGSGMVDDFIARKEGRADVKYPHPDLEPILEPTHGVILYQEQVMQIARRLAGYSLGDADGLRKAMGKKLPEEMARERSVFVSGAIERDVEPGKANQIFDNMEHFAGYGFNRAHSVAYALIACQTAWLKRHHLAVFMASALTADVDHPDRLVTLLDECRDLGLEVEPPDVNRCGWMFESGGPERVRFGLGAIRGVGRNSAEVVIEAREAGGPFADLFDFCRRVDPRRVNRRVREALIDSGALDALGPSRRAMREALERAMQSAEREARDAEAGQSDLFGADGPVVETWPDVPEYATERLLAGERDTLGVFLSGHPIEPHEAELAHLTAGPLAGVPLQSEGMRRVAGLVVAVRILHSRRGRMAFVKIEDNSGRLEVVVHAELLAEDRALPPERRRLGKDRIVVVEGKVEEDRGERSLRAAALYGLDEARGRFARRLAIGVRGTGDEGLGGRLEEALAPWRGDDGSVPVRLDYRCPAGRAEIELGPAWRVQPCADLLSRLRQLPGAEEVRLEYP